MSKRAVSRQLAVAVAYNAQGRLPAAEAACRAVLRARPNETAALHLLAVVLCRSGRLAEGEILLRRVLARHPDDPQALRHLGDAQHAQGRFVDSIGTFQRLLALMPDDAVAHLGLGLSLQAAARLDEAVEAYAQALTRQPGLPQGYFNLGTALHRMGRLDEAVAAYLRAVEHDPAHAEAYLNLGNALSDMGRHGDALLAYDHALQNKPDWPEALTNAGLAAQSLYRLDDALALQCRAVEVQQDFAAGWTNLGGVLQRLGRFDEAVAAFERASALRPGDALVLSNLAQAMAEAGRGGVLALHDLAVAADPDCAIVRFNRGVALLQAGQFAEGWRGYGWRWCGGVPGLVSRGFIQPSWSGESFQGRTLLLHAEQGLGDTLQFARFVAQAAGRGGRVVLEVQPAVAGVLARVAGAETVIACGTPLPPFDLHLPLMSLPEILGIAEDGLAAAPYIQAGPEAVARWRRRLGTGRTVGVAWSGNPAHRADRQRSIPAAHLLERLGRAPVRLFSLQKEVRADDLPALAALALTDLAPELLDFSDTAAAVAAMDLVITVDTAVAHLAGAMGRPVWLLLPFAADWRWLRDREDSPWYPSMRLFRQTRPGDWNEVLERVARALG